MSELVKGLLIILGLALFGVAVALATAESATYQVTTTPEEDAALEAGAKAAGKPVAVYAQEQLKAKMNTERIRHNWSRLRACGEDKECLKKVGGELPKYQKKPANDPTLKETPK